MRRFRLIIAAAACVGAAGPGQATAGPLLLDENFDDINGGVGALNFSGFTRWGVTQGTVDLIGNGFFDFLPGKGLYVDLDGSTNDAGVLSSQEFALSPGIYRVSFSLAGNQRNAAPDDVTVRFGDWSQTFHILASQPLTEHSFDIPVPAPATTRLTFENAGGDNIGALLDDARVFAIPTPAGAVALGLLSVSLLFRRGR